MGEDNNRQLKNERLQSQVNELNECNAELNSLTKQYQELRQQETRAI